MSINVLGNGDGLNSLAKYNNLITQTGTDAQNRAAVISGWLSTQATDVGVVGALASGSGPHRTGSNSNFEYNAIMKPTNPGDTSPQAWVDLQKWCWRWKSFGMGTTSATTSGLKSNFCHFQAQTHADHTDRTGTNQRMEHYIKELDWDVNSDDYGSNVHAYPSQFRGTDYLPNYDAVSTMSPSYATTSHYNPIRGFYNLDLGGGNQDLYTTSKNIGVIGSLASTAKHQFTRIQAFEPGSSHLYLYDTDNGSDLGTHLGFIIGTLLRYDTIAEIIVPKETYPGSGILDYQKHYKTHKYVEIGGFVSKSDDAPSDWVTNYWASEGNPSRSVSISDLDMGDFTLKKKVISVNFSDDDFSGDDKYSGSVEGISGGSDVALYKSEPTATDFASPTFFDSGYN